MKKVVYLALLVVVGFVVGCKQESAQDAATAAAKDGASATNAVTK
jgi:outer membrane lipoprotein-sorting protein